MSLEVYNIYFFIRKSLKFIIVSTCICVIIFEYSLYRLGESGSYDEIIKNQIKYNMLFGRKLTNQTSKYKITGAQIIKPEVLILGTSRIMQVRQIFFKSQTIYNAGINASTSRGINGMTGFLDAVNDSTNIKHIIIGLDPWLFNPNYPDNYPKNKTEILKVKLKNLLANIPLLYSGLKQIKLFFSNVFSRPIIYQKIITDNLFIITFYV